MLHPTVPEVTSRTVVGYMFHPNIVNSSPIKHYDSKDRNRAAMHDKLCKIGKNIIICVYIT